jgi:hypothetical protein
MLHEFTHLRIFLLVKSTRQNHFDANLLSSLKTLKSNGCLVSFSSSIERREGGEENLRMEMPQFKKLTPKLCDKNDESFLENQNV